MNTLSDISYTTTTAMGFIRRRLKNKAKFCLHCRQMTKHDSIRLDDGRTVFVCQKCHEISFD